MPAARFLVRSAFATALVAAVGLSVATRRGAEAREGEGARGYRAEVVPFLVAHCVDCHGGEDPQASLSLAARLAAEPGDGDADLWLGVARRLAADEMPPEGLPRPDPAEAALVLAWIERRFGAAAAPPPELRVTARRLNRTEYRNTVRDLVGVDAPGDLLPADDVGHGFDNVGDVLTLSPVLFEKYVLAAEAIARDAVPERTDPAAPPVRALAGADLEPDGGLRLSGRRWVFFSEGEAAATVDLPREGEYALRARAWADQAGPEPARLAFHVDGRGIAVLDVPATEGDPGTYETRVRLDGGPRRVAVAFVNDYYRPNDPDPRQRDRNLHVERLEVVGPLDLAGPSLSERLVFPEPRPEGREALDAWAGGAIERLQRRAWRRPPEPPDVERLLAAVARAVPPDASPETRVRTALIALLVSPRFLFRLEPGAGRALDAHEVASRLSYFLWASMPDERLSALADDGRLLERAVRDAEVRRLLADARSSALSEHFAPQWLQVRELSNATPDPARFPGVDAALLRSMERETVLLFDAVLREGRDVRDLLSADFTFLDERLARHYGIQGVPGDWMRRVPLRGERPGGVLAHGSVLTATSNPERTSPVKRGKWVLEAILDAPPPPPPPGVGVLDESADAAAASLRERLRRHRADPACAVCHDRMDPLGVALEPYDAVGRWRTTDEGHPVDATATLPDGRVLDGPAALAAALREERGFLRSLARHLLTYALGRGLGEADRPALDRLVTTLDATPTLEALAVAIAGLPAFLSSPPEPEERPR
jgi:hypothetical protein